MYQKTILQQEYDKRYITTKPLTISMEIDMLDSNAKSIIKNIANQNMYHNFPQIRLYPSPGDKCTRL